MPWCCLGSAYANALGPVVQCIRIERPRRRSVLSDGASMVCCVNSCLRRRSQGGSDRRGGLVRNAW